MGDKDVYVFNAGKKALVTFFVGSSNDDFPAYPGQWRAEPALVAVEKQLSHKFTSKLGFTHMQGKSVGLQDATKLPTEHDIQDALDALKDTDFSAFDGIVVVIAGHGGDDGLKAGPTAEKPKGSGPVPLRNFSEALRLSPQGGTSTTAALTLAGKPKVFIYECCRSISGSPSGLASAQLPFRVFDFLGAPTEATRTIQVPPDAIVGNGHFFNASSTQACAYTVQPGEPGTTVSRKVQVGSWYDEVRSADGTERITRFADFFFIYSTMPGYGAGIRNSSCNYLSKLVDKLVEKPYDLPSVCALANKDMQEENAMAGVAGVTTYPQCAVYEGKLRKLLYVKERMKRATELVLSDFRALSDEEQQELLRMWNEERGDTAPPTPLAGNSGDLASLHNKRSRLETPPAGRSTSTATTASLNEACDEDELPTCTYRSSSGRQVEYGSLGPSPTFRSLSVSSSSAANGNASKLVRLLQQLRESAELQELYEAGALRQAPCVQL